MRGKRGQQKTWAGERKMPGNNGAMEGGPRAQRGLPFLEGRTRLKKVDTIEGPQEKSGKGKFSKK